MRKTSYNLRSKKKNQNLKFKKLMKQKKNQISQKSDKKLSQSRWASQKRNMLICL